MHERVLGVIERYKLRDPNFFQTRPPVLYGLPSEPVIQSGVDRSFIDHPELEREKGRLSLSIRLLEELADERSIEFPSQKHRTRWGMLGERITRLMYIAQIHNGHLRGVEDGNTEGRSIVEVSSLHCAVLGTELTLHNTIQDRLEIARQAGVADRFREHANTMDFASGFVGGLKIDGIAVQDFADPTITKKSSVPYFQFLVVAQSLAYRDCYDAAVADNVGSVAFQFPNHTKWNLNVLSTRVSSMVSLSSQFFNGQISRAPQPLADVYKNSAKILDGVDVIRRKSRIALLDPQNPDSEGIREIVDVFLKSPLPADRLYILITLGINNLTNLYSAYRQTYKLVSGNYGEFYFDFAIAIREFVKDISAIKDILNDDDIDSFLLNQDVDRMSDQAIQDQIKFQGGFVNQIIAKTSQKFFEINPEILDLGNLATPRLIEVTLDKNRPRKIKVNLIYNNELDEETEIEFTTDTTKGTVDWNFLEDPEKPETPKIAVMRDELVRISSILLLTINNQAAISRQKSLQSSKADVQPQILTAKRERFDDPIYELRKQVREEQRAAATSQDTETIDIGSALQKDYAKNIILVDGDLSKRIHVDIDGKQIALASIIEYNERGVGSFTRKRRRGPDGKPRYTLRAGSLRVLVKEVSTSEGVRNYEIVDIRDRRNVYSKNAL